MTRQRRLFGRDADLAVVASTLARAGCCTVVGPGGVGKSAVARAVAAAGARRTVWVDAEPLADLDGLADALLRALGAERLPGQAPLDAAASALEGATVLVVLDGVEHLGEGLAPAVATWPVDADGAWLLATSRRPPGPGLRPVVRLAPLATDGGPAEDLLLAEVEARGADATALAADRDGWERALRATGGLPAAVQLTADHLARFGPGFADDGRLVPVEQVVDRCLRRTLDLLDEDDRRVFLQLGLTAGPFTLDVLAGYAGEPAPAARERAGRLVEHGLLLAVDGRLDLLPPVRDGAADLLETAGRREEALEHALAWAAATAAAPDPASAAVLDANLETCLLLARLATADPQRHPGVVALVHHLFDPMYRRLRWRELLALLEALAGTGILGPVDQAETARLAALCAGGCDTIARARRWLDQVHQVAARLDDPRLQATAWGADAWLTLDAGDHGRALDAAARALALSAGDAEVELPALRAVAETALAGGDLDRAEDVARQVLSRTDGPTSFDALLARSTLGWCLVERGRRAEAAAHARLLGADSRSGSEMTEIVVESELIALAADPRTRPRAPLLDDQRFSWWMRLEQRLRLAGRLPIEQHWEAVLHAAADVVVLADQVPLAHARLGGLLLLGDAALAGGDLWQAANAYEQALRDAVRGPARLRAADALDGLAVLAARTGQRPLATAAAATAAAVRRHAGAVAWPRPSLPSPVRVTSSDRPPPGWLRDGAPTPVAVDALAAAVRLPDPATDDWARLTHAERQVAELVCQGLGNAEIAAHLVVSRRTVESHLLRVFRKLDVRSRTQLAALRLRPR